jgi:hypothetical protein
VRKREAKAAAEAERNSVGEFRDFLTLASASMETKNRSSGKRKAKGGGLFGKDEGV